MGGCGSKNALAGGLDDELAPFLEDVAPANVDPALERNIEDVEFVFFDLDDCLYQNGYVTERSLTDRIAQYTVEHLNVPRDIVFALYEEHGTTIRGLIEEKYLEGDQIVEALEAFHDVDLKDVKPQKGLREMIQSIQKKRYIFTASIRPHAERCLKLLGIDDLFEDIVDCYACEYYSKHSDVAFKTAMRIAGAEHAYQCMLLDDSLRNTTTAYHLGWKCGVVGKLDRHNKVKSPEFYDIFVDTVMELPEVAPSLFIASSDASDAGVRDDQDYQEVVVEEDQVDIEVDVEVPEPEVEVEVDLTALPGLDVHSYKRVVFVMGGPGSGKGTVSALLLEECDFHHISAGDLLRKAKSDPKNPHSAEIARVLAAGELVPAQIIINLIIEEIETCGRRNFLLDGFPRSIANFEEFMADDRVNEGMQVEGVLLVECPDEVLKERLLARNREDDTEEAIKKRISIFHTNTDGILAKVEEMGDGKIWTIDSNVTMEAMKEAALGVVSTHIPEVLKGLDEE